MLLDTPSFGKSSTKISRPTLGHPAALVPHPVMIANSYIFIPRHALDLIIIKKKLQKTREGLTET